MALLDGCEATGGAPQLSTSILLLRTLGLSSSSARRTAPSTMVRGCTPLLPRSRVLPLWALACVVLAADPVSFLSNFTQEGTPTDLTAFATTGENILYQTHTLYLRVAFTRTCACVKYACRSHTHVWLHSVR